MANTVTSIPMIARLEVCAALRLPVIGCLVLLAVFGCDGKGPRLDESAGSGVPFPGHTIRTFMPAPSLSLTAHDGSALRLVDLRGKVVMLTAIYSSCGLSCPLIMAQAKRVVGVLSKQEREDLRVVGITLDPERDTPTELQKMAKRHGVDLPLFNFVTGDAANVNGVLDAFGFARQRNAESGEYDHVNLFVLVDRAGRIAFRFTLSEQQETWLVAGLRILVQEGGG